MAKNGMLARMEAAAGRGFMTGQKFTRQLCMDLSAIALNRLYGFGPERLQRFNDLMSELYSEYASCWNADTKDVSYSKETMDRALRQIWGDRFQEWDERYN